MFYLGKFRLNLAAERPFFLEKGGEYNGGNKRRKS